MKIKKVGMRTIKTAIAVSLTIGISQLLRLKSPFFAGIAAIVAMQTSVSESLNTGKSRMYGTIIGGIVALLFSLSLPENSLLIGIGVLVVIYICNMLKFKEAASLSTMVFLSIILNQQENNRFNYAFYRTLDTWVGLVIGTLINYFILPPNMEEKIQESIDHMYKETKDIVEKIIWKEEYAHLENLKKELINIEDNYAILKRDIKLNLCKTKNNYDFEYIFELFESIYNHLGIICSMERPVYINDLNKEYLKNLLKKEVPLQIEEDSNYTDIVYNYHLGQILEKLKIISDN